MESDNNTKLNQIGQMAPPMNLAVLRLYLWTINYLRNVLANLRQMTTNLQPLMKKAQQLKHFEWMPGFQSEFEKIKTALMSRTVLYPFDTTLSTGLYINYSKEFLGLALVQWNEKDPQVKRLIWCSSRSHKSIQDLKIPPVCGEGLAAMWAV